MPHKDPVDKLAYDRLWRQRNAERVRESSRAHNKKKRLAAIEKLGGHCITCWTSDPRVLQFDHVNGGGSLERRTSTGWGGNLITAILRDQRSDIQLLCANCHSIRTWHNG